MRRQIKHCAETVLFEPTLWERRIRIGFWVFGLASGLTLAYTTRHYVNGDAIAYLDMAEAFRRGLWDESVNLTYSPGYPLLLWFVQTLIPVDALNETNLAKLLNLCCFLVAMWTCDLFVRELKAIAEHDEIDASLPFPALSVICFASFLFTSLTWVRVQIITPDMLVFVFLMLCVIAIMRILRSPGGYRSFIFLGLVAGLGYLCKTSFFPFSCIVFACAAGACRSVTHAIPRILTSLAVMILVGSPVMISQSLKAGRLSIGESGSYNYAYWVAGTGQAMHQPEVVYQKPKVLAYREGHVASYPPGDDPSYWALGIRPVFNLRAQFSAFRTNLEYLLGQTGLIALVIIVWFVAQFRRAIPYCRRLQSCSSADVPPLLRKVPNNGADSLLSRITRSTLHSRSLAWVLILFALAGVTMHCLVVMEIRYVSPFLFLGIVGLALLTPRFDRNDPTAKTQTVFLASLLAAFLVANVALLCGGPDYQSYLYRTGQGLTR